MHKIAQLKLQLLPGEENHKYFTPIIIDATCHSHILYYIIISSLANYRNNVLWTTRWLQTIVISPLPFSDIWH